MKGNLPLLMAVGSIIMGLLAGTWLWLYPFIGLPVALAGLICGGLALKTPRHNTALAGTVFSLVGMFLVLLNLGIELLLGPGVL